MVSTITLLASTVKPACLISLIWLSVVWSAVDTLQYANTLFMLLVLLMVSVNVVRNISYVRNYVKLIYGHSKRWCPYTIVIGQSVIGIDV